MLLFVPLFLLDSLFVLTNLIKFFDGAWFTLAITTLISYLIYTWIKGNKVLQSQKIIVHTPIKEFIKGHLQSYLQRIPGTAVFLSRDPFKIPSSFLMQLHHNKYLHEKVIFVSLMIKKTPSQKADERFSLESITDDTAQLVCNFGFKEIPDLNKGLQWLKENNIIDHEEDVSFFISRGISISSKLKLLSGFSEKLYIALMSLSQNARDFYRIPHHKVIELGIRYKI